MSIRLTITNQTTPPAVADMRWLKQHLLKTLQLLHIRNAEWSIAIVNDQEMTALHARTMNLPTTTDVLTFDLRDPPHPPRRPPPRTARARVTSTPTPDHEGTEVELDTVLCRDEAARRAADLHHSLREELLLYAIHSLLHVQGYDDLHKADAQRMHRREDSLLIALGVGPLYAAQKSRIPKTSSKGVRP